MREQSVRDHVRKWMLAGEDLDTTGDAAKRLQVFSGHYAMRTVKLVKSDALAAQRARS